MLKLVQLCGDVKASAVSDASPGHRTLTTQINLGGDPLAAGDFVLGTRGGCRPRAQA